MTTNDPIYFTVAEVATMLRVCHMTVYRLVNAGKLEATRVGPRTIRILAASLFERYPELRDAPLPSPEG